MKDGPETKPITSETKGFLGTSFAWTSHDFSLQEVLADAHTLEQQLQEMAVSSLRATTDLPPDFLIAVTNAMRAYQMGAGPQFTQNQIALPTPPDMESLLQGLHCIARTYLAESVLSLSSTLGLMKLSINLIIGTMQA